MENEKPNYYAIIPADVRYDNDLRANEKLLYGEITALTKKTGECWASNKYFSELYGVKENAVATWIRHLKEKQYIDITYEYNGKEIIKRIIKIGGIQKDTTWYPKRYEGGIQKDTRGGIQKDIDNNTRYINNTSINNKRKYIKESENIISKLNELNGTKYKPTTDETLKLIKARIEEGYTEADLLLVVEKMSYLWNKEPSKNEKDMRPYLRPSTLFRKSNFENYLNMPVNKKRDIREIKEIDVMEVFK